MVRILTDSTSDLGPELAVQRNIEIIPLYVIINGQSYLDGVNLTLDDLFASVRKTGQLPKTSAPTVPDFKKAFDPPGQSVYIGISSRVSSTIQNATLAQQEYEPDRVYVIDSLNLTAGLGLLALKAADLRDQGLPAEAIYQQISALVPKVRTSFAIETLEYLYKGGRCSAVQSLVGGLLSIRPVIAMRGDGTLGIKARTRGARSKALTYLLDAFMDDLPEIDLQRVFVAHTHCPADAEYLKSELLKRAPIGEVHITHAGSVIASHCGPETIAILYMLK